MGIPGSWKPRRGRDPRCPGLGSTSPGDEENDAQRVGGDGEEVESERGPEGDEGATEEHRYRHGTGRSQSQGTCADPRCLGRFLSGMRGGAGLPGAPGSIREGGGAEPGRRGLEVLRGFFEWRAGRTRGGALGAFPDQSEPGGGSGRSQSEQRAERRSR